MKEFLINSLGVASGVIDIVAQAFGIVGLVIIVASFQCKKNRNFFLMQGIGSFMFFINFIMINAYGGAFFNLANLVRGLLFSKDTSKKWKLVVVEILYTACFAFSLFLDHSVPQIVLAAIPFIALVVMSVFMWLGNSKHIRYSQIVYMSPAWIVHNIFNFSLGGLLCESFNMISSVIYLIRLKREEKSIKSE
jgi:hypothetical protein